MPSALPTDVTHLLQAARDGDPDAVNRLFEAVYTKLKRLARKVRQGRPSDTINTTALVHEAYLKLVRVENVQWASRLHFFRVAAQAMRQVLVNAANARTALKRGGGAPTVPFAEGIHTPAVSPHDVLALDDALTRLEAVSERQARVVECRFFAGLTVDEIAEALDVSPSTVKRDWRAARAWLSTQL